jgi:rod shape determining protein RodA
MMDRMMDSRKPDHFEWRFLAVIVAILSLGVLSIYSATYSQPVTGLPLYVKQIIGSWPVPAHFSSC